ncbi:unnamed protein product [Closterium sp. Naga37s-1]|nr:unnamed protein product [Closterium sp. Naga37s-1]
MADRPHRAVIIFGDGLLIDGPPPASRSAEPSSRISASAAQRTRTPLETVDAPALHRVAADGVSGLLALRQLPSHVSEEQREALELAQLLDIFHCAHAPLPQDAGSTTHPSDPTNPTNPTTAAAPSAPHISWETNPTPMSERFMGMEAAFVTSSPVSLALARTAGFRTTRLNRTALPSTSHHLLVTGESDDLSPTSAAEGNADAGGDEAAGAAVAAATAVAEGEGVAAATAGAAPDPSVLAARIVAALGLHREEVPGPPPSAAEREAGEVDLLLLHVRPADVAPWGGSAGEKIAGGLPEATGEAGMGGAGAGGAVTGAGRGEGGAMEGQVWGQAEQAIQWVDSLVAELLRWRDGKARKGEEGEGEEGSGSEGTAVSSDVPSYLPLRAQNHLYLAVVLGYGDQGNQQVPPAAAAAAPEQSTDAPWSPVPLRSLPIFVPPLSAAAAAAAPGASASDSVPCVPRVPFVPRQSYELRGDEPVEAIRSGEMSTKEGDRPRPGDRLGTERFDAESGASGSGAGENGGAIRVVVVGNKGTGKTSLIISCLTEAFPEEPVPVLPPTRYLADSFSDKIPLLIVDTSSRSFSCLPSSLLYASTARPPRGVNTISISSPLSLLLRPLCLPSVVATQPLSPPSHLHAVCAVPSLTSTSKRSPDPVLNTRLGGPFDRTRRRPFSGARGASRETGSYCRAPHAVALFPRMRRPVQGVVFLLRRPPRRALTRISPFRVACRACARRREERGAVEAELRAADAVVITFACDDQASLNSVSSYWLPLLRQLQVPVPVVVVGCKLDLRDAPGAAAAGGVGGAAGGAGGAGAGVAQQPLDVLVAPIMDEFKEVETCLECSALRRVQVAEVFFFAQRAVLHPTGPLFDRQTQALRPACVRALMRIFMLCDVDGDGVLSDTELNAFQVECFSVPLQPAELVGVKRVVAEKMVDGVAGNGLTLTGFLFLHALFIERGRLETTWTVLRKFGYSSSLHLREEITRLPAQPLPDQSVELSSKALEFVCARFRAFDNDQDGALNTSELNNLFSTAPNSPWEEAPYLGAAETSPSGALTFSGYLSLWSLMALLHPERAIEYLLYLGFPSDLAPSALTFTRRRRSDRKAGSSQRRVLQCFVVGPAQAGKTALLSSLLGRPFEHTHIKYGEDERFAVNLVSTDPQAHSASSSSSASSASSSSTTSSSLSSNRDPSSIASQDLSALASCSTVLVLREVHPDALPRLLARPDWLAACDVAAFVYDSSSQGSWEKAVGMLQEVAGRAEASECEMPAVLVAAKNDLEPHPAIFTQSAQLCTEMGVAAPVPVSSLLHDVNELWTRLTDAARKPHVGIPETSASRSSKALRKRLLYRSVSVALVGTAVAVVLVVGFRIYAARRSSST